MASEVRRWRRLRSFLGAAEDAGNAMRYLLLNERSLVAVAYSSYEHAPREFTMLLIGSSALGLGLLRLMTGELNAAMAYTIAVVAGYSAGTWYGKASRELSGKTATDHAETAK